MGCEKGNKSGTIFSKSASHGRVRCVLLGKKWSKYWEKESRRVQEQRTKWPFQEQEGIWLRRPEGGPGVSKEHKDRNRQGGYPLLGVKGLLSFFPSLFPLLFLCSSLPSFGLLFLFYLSFSRLSFRWYPGSTIGLYSR